MHMGVIVSQRTIRRTLNAKGYYYLRRAQKAKLSRAIKSARCRWARRVLRLTVAELREELGMAMDGIVLARPPSGELERENFCTSDETHMWRKKNEAASPALAGADIYSKQMPPERVVGCWGGISDGGFEVVVFHPGRKITTSKWVGALKSGKLQHALKRLWPRRRAAAWKVLCDGETFLRTAASREAYADIGVTLWDLPPKSPDLNPVEKFWAWLRKGLRRLDLADLRAERPVPAAAQYQARVRALGRSQKAKRVAQSCVRGLRAVCRLLRRTLRRRR